jgi:hypothetical protein
MRHPGREFGSEAPTVIYVALRWNAAKPIENPDKENRMRTLVAERLHVRPKDLRIFNLVPPSKGWKQRSQSGEFPSEHQYSWRVSPRPLVPPMDRPASGVLA